MGEGDPPLISIEDARRGISVDGRRSVYEACLDVSMEREGVNGGLEEDNGRCGVDAEVRALTEDETTRTRFDGDLE
jgi:hypothetical protein